MGIGFDTPHTPPDQIRRRMEPYKSDFEDFANTRPEVIDGWKSAKTMGGRDSPECARVREEIRTAVLEHYKSRHPDTHVMEREMAYLAYAWWVRQQ